MYAKTILLALAATMASAIAVPEPVADAEPATSILAARASSTATSGAVLFYSKPSYSGSAAVYDVDQGETPWCIRFHGPGDIGANFTTIGSYISGNIACFTFPSDDCSGNANGAISGSNTTANIATGSLYCSFQSS